MHPSSSRRRRSVAIGAFTASCLLIPSAAFAAAQAPSTPGTYSSSTCQSAAGSACPGFQPLVAGHVLDEHESSVLSTSQCEAQLGIACYTGTQLRKAYDLGPLYQRGITGAGQTIVIVDFFGSPTLQHDLNVFSKAMGIPSTTVTVDHYDGSPAFDPTDPGVVGWEEETTLDVETVHEYAPKAKIEVVLPNPDGYAPMPAAVKATIDKSPASVVSFSFGAPESDFYDPQTGYAALNQLRYAFQDAAARHITLVASTGDWGAATVEDDGSLSTSPATCWPATDPDVVAVGGTSLHLNDQGARLSPDTVWNDSYGASGGGLSSAFSRPAYQDTVSSVTGDRRGVPDISTSADVNGGEEVYWSFDPATAGWAIIGGTSEAAPTVSAITALGDQAAGYRLGNIDNALYLLQRFGGYNPVTGLVKVTEGNNSWGGVAGYDATSGYSLATGLGTLNASELVTALSWVGGLR